MHRWKIPPLPPRSRINLSWRQPSANKTHTAHAPSAVAWLIVGQIVSMRGPLFINKDFNHRSELLTSTNCVLYWLVLQLHCWLVQQSNPTNTVLHESAVHGINESTAKTKTSCVFISVVETLLKKIAFPFICFSWCCARH